MSETYFAQEAVDLALAYKDPQDWFKIDEIFVSQYVDAEKDEYRVDDELAWYQRLDFHLGKDGYPLDVDYNDSTIAWACEPRGRSFPLAVRKLKQYRRYGFSSAEQMKQRKWEYLIHMALISKELAGIAAIADDTNYHANNLHTQGAGDFTTSTTTGLSGLAWSNVNSTPINDVDFLSRENPRGNTLAFSWITLHDLMINPQILDAGSITASDRDGMSPSVSIRYLESVFKKRVVVFMAEAVTSATADLPLASQAKGQMWGDYVWHGLVNKASQGPRIDLPTWGHQYIFAPVVDNRGWIMNETIDARSGLTGLIHMDCGYFNQFKKYAYLYGQRLDGIN